MSDETEGRLAYRVWIGGEQMPGECTHDQLRTNLKDIVDVLEADGDELNIRILAVAPDDDFLAGSEGCSTDPEECEACQ